MFSAAFAVLQAGIPALPVADLQRLARLPMPKAVVYGADDPEYAPDSAAQTAARIGAPPPTLIPDARHLTMISDPDAVAAAVQSLAVRAAAAQSTETPGTGSTTAIGTAGTVAASVSAG